MEATKEQIMTTAAILLAGAMSGDQSSSSTHSRLTITAQRYVKDAVELAKMIASEVYGE